MNGAVMKNFATDDRPFASALAGQGGTFVSEVDESDGSIALYAPRIAVLNNVSLDHKSMEELRELFGGFLGRAGTAVVNYADAEARSIAAGVERERLVTFSLYDGAADLVAEDIAEEPLAIRLTVRAGSEAALLQLQVPGRHNAANALAALAAARAAGVPLAQGAEALSGFTGLRRRFDVVGTRGGVSVIDDFAHNPDKIGATLKTLHAFPGRLLLFFQPHGYGPLKVMKDELVDTFAVALGDEDVLLMPEPVYFGGTVERAVTSGDVVQAVAAAGRKAEHIADRVDCGRRLGELARPGDRIVIMGARDDTLSQFAHEVLESL
jgi:UDP-N-acetylmuramate--alanine ligase